ncbi:hypothetical protein ACK8N7_06705 [Streptomyces griseobrunneus]
MITFVVLLLVAVVLGSVWTALGMHGPLLGRMPGRLLQRHVQQPRLWGAGALLMVISRSAHSPSLLVIGIGLVALGHVVKPIPRQHVP